MPATPNPFKRALAAGQRRIGLWSSFASNVAAEIVGDAGFDWILFDCEHAPVDPPQLHGLLQAAASGTAHPVVRPAWNDPVLIKRVLDVGAQTILVPFVQSAEEAALAVGASRYPPAGVRGVAGSTRSSRYGATADYLKTANEEICVLVQIETREAIDALEAIARIPGVDGVFIGPSDLAASLGHLGEPGHPEVQETIRSALARLDRISKPAGILATTEEDARRYLDWGVAFVAVGVDLSIFAGGVRARARAFGL